MNFNVYMGYDRRGEGNAFRVAELLKQLNADVAAVQVTGTAEVCGSIIVSLFLLLSHISRGIEIAKSKNLATSRKTRVHKSARAV